MHINIFHPVEIKLQNRRGQNVFNCVVRPTVCGDGGHIIRLHEYRPGSSCMHNAENLKNLASSKSNHSYNFSSHGFLNSLSSIPVPCFLTVNVPQRDTCV